MITPLPISPPSETTRESRVSSVKIDDSLTTALRYSRVITFPEFILPRFLTPTFVYSLGSPKFRRWIIDRLPWKNLQVLKGIIDTMHNTSTALFQDHLDAFGRGEGEDKDVLSILSARPAYGLVCLKFNLDQ